MRIPKVHCERCNKDVTVNFTASKFAFMINVTVRCAECNAPLNINEAIERELCRFLNGATLKDYEEQRVIYGPSGIINQKEVKSYDITRKN